MVSLWLKDTTHRIKIQINKFDLEFPIYNFYLTFCERVNYLCFNNRLTQNQMCIYPSIHLYKNHVYKNYVQLWFVDVVVELNNLSQTQCQRPRQNSRIPSLAVYILNSNLMRVHLLDSLLWNAWYFGLVAQAKHAPTKNFASPLI